MYFVITLSVNTIRVINSLLDLRNPRNKEPSEIKYPLDSFIFD